MKLEKQEKERLEVEETIRVKEMVFCVLIYLAVIFIGITREK